MTLAEHAINDEVLGKMKKKWGTYTQNQKETTEIAKDYNEKAGFREFDVHKTY